MIHPQTELRFINEEIGYGVFAREAIPRGTMVYVKDALEIVISEKDPLLGDPVYRQWIERYSYILPDGSRVLSWDMAKYVNHSCDSNTLTCGFGFEIAVRDIAPGEQITDDYGIFNIESDMVCSCGAIHCRGRITANDPDGCHAYWDRVCQKALSAFYQVPQPLLPYLDENTSNELDRFLATGDGYPSVLGFKYLPFAQSSEVMTTLEIGIWAMARRGNGRLRL